MRNTLLGSLTGLLMPLASYGMASASYNSYQRNHSQVVKYETVTLGDSQSQRVSAIDVHENELTLQSGSQLTELIIVDAAVPDKHALRKLLKPGVALVELDSNLDAVQQIVSELEKYHDLRAVHLVSHAEAGALQIGKYQLDRNNLHQQESLWTALNKATRSGADLMLYGCNLAAENDEVLDIIQNHTHLDVAASDNFTGAEGLGGDWNLEIHAGDIQTKSFSASALKDFSDVLATTVDFQSVGAVADGSTTTQSGYVFSLTHLTHGIYPNAGLLNTSNANCRQAGLQYSLFTGYLDYYGAPADKVYITKNGGGNFALKNIRVKGVTTGIYAGVGGGTSATAGVKITAYKSGAVVGTPVTQTGISGAFVSIDLSANSDFSSVDKVRIQPLKSGGTDSGSICLKTVGFDVPNAAPTDISLTSSSVNQSGGTNAVVGTLSSTDADVGNTHTYTLVAGAGSTDNASFNISGSSLRANNAAALAAGNYSVRIRTTDNVGATYEEAFTITVVDNVPPAVSSITLSGSPAATASSVDFVVAFNSSANNISLDDFQLTTTSGTASGTIASVSASSGTSVNVTVNGISGNGVLRLDLKASTNITDAAGNGNNTNGYVAAFTSGSTHTVAIPTAPNAPTIGAATAGDGQVSVAFSAPGSNGGSAITGYTVTSNPGGITGGGNGFTTSPITVSGLTNGQAYTFTVTATNAIGTSTASGASGSATPKADQTITFANPGSQNFGTTPPLSGTSTSGLTVTFSSATTGVCTVSGTTLTFVTAGACTIDADQAGNASTNAAPTVSRTFTVNAVVPGAPTIGTATAGDTQADVAFSVPASNGGATITGYTVTSNPGGFTGTGAGSPITVTGLTNGVSYTFTVTATNSAGTGAASGASNSITPASPQIITFANPGAQSFGTSPDLGVGVSSTSGLTVAFTSSTTGVCTITGAGVLTFVSTGTCTINANQAGDSTYLPAPQVTRSFTVNPANQTITFTNPGAQNFGGSPTLSGSSTSGLTVTFSSSTTGVCTITSGGALTFVTAGTCTIDADQAGDATTNAAMTVSRTFTVNAIVPGAPTIGTATAGDTQADVAFTAPASNGGSTITGYTVTSNPGGFTGTGAGSPVTVAGLTNGVPYTFTVTATNVAGTGGASGPSNSITPASPQVITFANPGTQSFGTAPDLSVLGGGASSTSGLTVAFTSSTTGVCTITSGGILAFVTAGTCTINVNQAGNSQYLPAPQVSRSFTVSPIVPDAPTIGTAVAGDTQASVAFTAPGNTGGTTITGYTVSVSPPDVAPVNGASSPIAVTGLTNGQAYTFTVTADNSAGTGPASGASNSITPKATQTITFNNPGTRNFGTAPTFTATSDSGLSPTFTSSTTGVCTITGLGAVTFITAGTCTINADQAGNGSYLAATQVTRSFTVNAVVPGAPTIGAATAGNTQATVTFTAPASNGGTAITGYTVTSNPGGIVRAATASPFTFTGLTNGTSYTFTVTATNSAGTGAASAASNAVTPSLPPNSAPVITQGGSVSVTMNEDGTPTPFSLSLSATDADSDPLTWSISSVAQHGSASVSGGSVGYTPTANYNGSDSFVVQVSDGSATASTTVNVTVTAVNDLPLISGAPATSLDQDTAYSFTPTASDLDTADVLTFSIANKPTWASFNTATGALTGTPAGTDSGKTIGIVISVSDGTASAALPAFDIEVISTIDPLQPIVTAPANLELNAIGLFTPVNLTQLLGVGPNTSPAEVEQMLKAMATDGVSGNSCCTTVVVGLTGNFLLLPPGRHEIKWKATNAVGVSGEATQIVDIKPLVSLSKSQVAVRGSDVEFRVLLNGPAPEYPLSIPYSVDASTTATASEHNLSSGTATISQSGQVEVAIPVSLAAVTGFSDSQLVVVLGGGINAGSANRHVIDIRQGNVPPVVSLSISQGGVNTSLITPAGGPVTVTATVTDANKDDTHTFDWSATSGLADTDGNSTNASRTFDPAGLTGSHQLQVKVTDSGGANVQASAYFRVVASLPVLDVNTDTDQDGIGDSLEGTGDTDDNGIPDYLDNMPSPNILPQQSSTTNAYLIECDPGVRCGLGLFARSGNSGGVQILDQEVGTLTDLVVDPAFEPVGGVFDFAIRDLPTPGQSVRVVIPQRSAIPANAVYRKYQRGRWVTFITDTDNAVHSAEGTPGYCPPPGSADWKSGLTAGHTCVQLTIEDGGPNDDDGLVNSAVVDPGAVSVAQELPPKPEPPKPPVQVNSKGGGSMGGLWIALLGGLLMFRRIKHRHWLALVALLSSHSQAQNAEDFYLRADVFSAESTQEEEDFNGALTSAGHEFSIGKYDADRTGFQLAVGYNWNNFTYTQFGYLDLGDVQVGLLLDGEADQQAFAADLADEYPITATGVTLVQGVKLGLGETVNLGFEAGVYLWEGEVDVNGLPFSIAEDSGTDPLAGVLLDLPLGDHFTLGIGLRRVFFSKQEVNLYSFGSSYHF